MVKVSGSTIDPPRLNTPIEGARAALADPTVEMATPMVNRCRRPNRSPSAAPVSSSTAKVSVQAFTVHSRLDSEAAGGCG